MPESEMPDPEKFRRIKRLPPDVFAGVDRPVQRADEILPEHPRLPEYSPAPEYLQVKEAGA